MVIQKVRGSPGRARHGGGGASPRGALRLRLRLCGAEAAAGATRDPRPATRCDPLGERCREAAKDAGFFQGILSDF